MNRINAFVFLLFASLCGQAQTPVTINAEDRLMIGRELAYFVDPARTLSTEEAMQQSFQKGEAEILNLGTIPHNVWIRFSVNSHTEKKVYLEVRAPLLDTLQLYKVENGRPVLMFDGGMGKPFRQKPIESENWLFNLDLHDGGTHTYLLKVHSLFPFQLPVALSSKDAHTEYTQQHHLFWGLYIGVILFAFLYNLFIYLSVRERKYLYYILYVLGSLTFYLGLEGFSYQFLWPRYPYFNYLLPVVICVTNILVTLFTQNFLNITRQQAFEYFGSRILIIAFALTALANLAGGFSIGVVLGQSLSLFACLFYITAGVRSYRRRVPSARYLLLAWTIFLVFVITFILTSNNVIAPNFFTTHCIFIGHMTEVGLLSFALASRINWLKSENEKNQKEIIRQLRLNEEIQLEANRMLEQKVRERTAEVVEQRNEAVKQRQRSDELLLNILPKEIADEIKSTGAARARHFRNVTVLFTDIRNFTQLSEKLSPEAIVREINEFFSAFDQILEAHGVEKVKTIGDAYMAAGGLPIPNDTHARDVVLAALAIAGYVEEQKKKRVAAGKLFFELRIGIHSGSVVAGVVGLKKFAYDVWGDTVNIASRMESCGEVGKVNISTSTYELIRDEFNCTYRGKFQAKNKGMIDMYFVEGIKTKPPASSLAVTEHNELL
jgi:class 3 adenylate cyclase